MKDNGFMLSPEKNKFTIFSKTAQPFKPPALPGIYNTVLPIQKTIKFLGIVFKHNKLE